MMRAAFALLAAVSLGACLAAPVFFFSGSLSESAMKGVFLAASVGWFGFASAWSRSR